MRDLDAEEKRLTDRLDSLLSNSEAAFHQVQTAMHTRIAVPDGWNMVPLDKRPPKEKVTLRIDAEVLDYFRATGMGWQTRLNGVLRLFMGHRSTE